MGEAKNIYFTCLYFLGDIHLAVKMASFLSQVSLRGFCSSVRTMAAVNHVTVIGGGLMGSGIVQVAAQAGINVTMVDMSEDVLQKSVDRIGKSLGRVVKKKFAADPAQGEAFMAETLGKISTSTDAVATSAATASSSKPSSKTSASSKNCSRRSMKSRPVT